MSFSGPSHRVDQDVHMPQHRSHTVWFICCVPPQLGCGGGGVSGVSGGGSVGLTVSSAPVSPPLNTSASIPDSEKVKLHQVLRRLT